MGSLKIARQSHVKINSQIALPNAVLISMWNKKYL